MLVYEMFKEFTNETIEKNKEIKLIADKYLSEEAKALDGNADVIVLEDGQNALKEDPTYKGAHIGYTIKKNQTLEEGIKHICDLINEAVKNKWIEKACMCSVHCLELIDGRVFLLYFSFTKYSLKELREMSGQDYRAEGDIINDNDLKGEDENCSPLGIHNDE